MESRGINRSRSLMLLFGVICGLYITRLYSPQLFASVAGIFSIIVACGIFMVAWNSRSIFDNGYFQFLGVAFLSVAGFDLLHTFAITSAGSFPKNDQNLPAQLWIAARYLQSISLFVGPLLLGRKLKIHLVFIGFGLAFLAILASIYPFAVFPVCFEAPDGLTPFAHVSEILTALILSGSLALLVKKKRYFDEGVFRLLVISTIFSIVSEIAFAFHGSTADLSNLLGHLCKTLSFYVFHNAIIDAGFILPYNLLVMHLRQSETELILANEELENRVQERIVELDKTNSVLREEINERKSAEEEKRKLQIQLLQAQKLDSLGKLAGGVAHDFNNLVSAVLGFSELAMEQIDRNRPEWEFIQIIHSVGEKAAALTSQLLAFSRRQMLEMKVFNLNSVVEDMGKMLRRIIGEHIELRFTPRIPLKNVLADINQVEQILLNLVINARDAMPSGGCLTIATSEAVLDDEYCARHEMVTPGQYVLLTVADTGEGMTREVQERIFEPFFTTKEQGKGTGLGLATVYGIVKQHNGHIDVTSDTGKGTTFRIYLPAVNDEKSATEPESRQPMARGTETVLVVDDEQYIRRLITATLRPLGYHILEAGTGEDAISMSELHQNTIHLLVTDVVMPGMNGCDLAKRLTALRSDLRVLYMSGYTDTWPENLPIDKGAGFLQKPLSPHRLAARVREVLDRV